MIFTWFDAILAGVMIVSGLLALMRGLTREMLSILSWVGGAIAAWILYPILKETARSYFPPDSKIVADVVLVAVVFLVVLIVIYVITMRISDWILDSGVGVLDRTLGFLFGLVRGLLLVVVAYLLVLWGIPREKHPSGLRDARALPIVNQTAEIIISYMPTEIAEVLFGKIQELADPEAPNDQPPAAQEPPSDDDDATQNDSSLQEGYNGNERSGLNQLLQSTQDNQN